MRAEPLMPVAKGVLKRRCQPAWILPLAWMQPTAVPKRPSK